MKLWPFKTHEKNMEIGSESRIMYSAIILISALHEEVDCFGAHQH